MIENGFVHAANKALHKERKQENRLQTKKEKLYKILEKKGKSLVELKTEDLNKTELKIVKDLGFGHYLEINDKFA